MNDRFSARENELSILWILPKNADQEMKDHYVDDPEEIDGSEIEKAIAKGFRVVVQFSKEGYRSSLLDELNDCAKVYGRDLTIRFYGHYRSEFDAAILLAIPDAACVSINCLTRARNLGAVKTLRNLREFSLGIFEMEEKDILAYPALQNVERLALGESRKSNIDLRPLRNFSKLRNFYTAGHAKNIDAISCIPSITSLTLSRIKKNIGLSFVSDLANLSYLEISLGADAPSKKFAAGILRH